MTDEWRAGDELEHVGPGMYVDKAGGLHLDIPELLAFFGYVDTPHNRRVLADGAVEAFRREFPELEVVED